MSADPISYKPKVVDLNCVPRPYPERVAALPDTREAFDAELLGSLVRNKYPGAAARGLDIVETFDTHTTKIRIKVDWNDAARAAGLPAHLCVKSNWSGGFHNVDIHAVEARFYHFLAADMKVPTARCYYADWDDSGSGQGIVLLEDLEQRGGRFDRSGYNLGIDSIAAALPGLAGLHGSLWGSEKISPEQAPWLQSQMDTPVDTDQVRIMWPWIEMNLQDPNFVAVAPKHYLDDPRSVERAFDRLGEIERAIVDLPYCVQLGDCHPGNTYVLPNGERLWLDWQLVRRGRPWRDLTYFLIGALTIEERRKHLRDLVAQYREHLLATGARGVVSLEEFYDHIRLWVMYGVQVWVATIEGWGHDIVPMNERFFAAAEDMGTWKLLLDR